MIMKNSIVWVIDTTVLCNILDIPGRNQHRASVINDFKMRIRSSHRFILPFTTVLETGNFIGQIKGEPDRRKKFATSLVDLLRKSVNGEVPWRTMEFPETNQVMTWLEENPFTNDAGKGVGFGDYLILRQTESQRLKALGLEVYIWSLDGHLMGR